MPVVSIRDKRIQKIIDKHIIALIEDIRDNDIPAVGVSGAIITAGGPDDVNNNCCTFTIAVPGLKSVDKNGVERDVDVRRFMLEVVTALIRTVMDKL